MEEFLIAGRLCRDEAASRALGEAIARLRRVDQ
jgi:hypothetical protein